MASRTWEEKGTASVGLGRERRGSSESGTRRYVDMLVEVEHDEAEMEGEWRGCRPIAPQSPVPATGFCFRSTLTENVETRPCHPGGDHGNSTNDQGLDALYGRCARKHRVHAIPHDNRRKCVGRNTPL